MHTDSDSATTDRKLLRRLRLGGLVAGGVAALIVVTGVATRLNASRQTEAFVTEQAVQPVAVVRPSYSTGSGTLKLPGTLAAFFNAPIYARVSGYVHEWYKDIGAHVRKGELLATIDAPELDQQIEQAKADLANALAAEKLSQTTAQRWTGLLALDAVSKQEAEEKSGDLAVKNAQVAAAKANLDRLDALKQFARIVAPFDGVVTNRSIDIGMLVNAGAQTTGNALFTVADMHKLRVYVSVPQTYSSDIRAGLKATLKLPEHPGQSFPASLDSTSDAISEKSNTLLVELLADNPNGELKPGEYVQVTLELPASNSVVVLPASALIFRQDGLQVATVTSDDRIRMRKIEISRDLGTQVEVNGGLAATDQVVDNPPDSIAGGDRVRVIPGSAR